MNASDVRLSHVVVADARPRDYRGFDSPDEEIDWRVHFLSGGAAAVQFARRRRADLWLINSRLPDMSGLELLSVLRDLRVSSPVFVVADCYNAGEERRACAGGATLYLCKDADRKLDVRPLLETIAAREPPVEAMAERQADYAGRAGP